MERNQAEEISRSADRITEAVRELSSSVDRLGELQAAQVPAYREVLEEVFQRARARRSDEGLPENIAAWIADEAVHRARAELSSLRPEDPKSPPPSPEEVEEWEERRRERKERGVYS